jgi:membrane-associated phospholipid phosphatase
MAGIFHEKNLSFPSGHATLAFATAAALAIFLPRWRAGFYIVAAMVAAERVLENAHYVSDVVAGALVGWICAQLIARLLQVRPFLQPCATTDNTSL